MTPTLSDELRELVRTVMDACGEGRVDDALAGWERLQTMGPLPEAVEAIPIYLLLARGEVLEALRLSNSLPERLAPEARMLALWMAEDPTWQGHAERLLDSPEPLMRESARVLLDAHS